jgi:hypothetical protein
MDSMRCLKYCDGVKPLLREKGDRGGLKKWLWMDEGEVHLDSALAEERGIGEAARSEHSKKLLGWSC